MQPHLVKLIKLTEQMTSVTIEATDAAEAERFALDLVPDDSRDWVVVHREVLAKAEVNGG